MNRFPDFQSALRTWTFRLWDEMRPEVGGMRQNECYLQRGGGGDIVGTMREASSQVWPEHFGFDAFHYAEWALVVKAWHNDPLLWAQHQTQVGPPGFKSPVIEQEVGFAFWPSHAARNDSSDGQTVVSAV